MRVILISMPDVVPVIIHEAAFHLSNHVIASVGANIDIEHDIAERASRVINMLDGKIHEDKKKK